MLSRLGKADDMGSHRFQPAEIKALSRAIRNSRGPAQQRCGHLPPDHLPQVLEVDQHSKANRQVLENENLRAWLAKSSSGKDDYLAIFNLGPQPQEVYLRWKQVGVQAASAEVRDV
jgi:hypothetical protein